MSQFYVAKPGDTAATLNAALAAGLNLFFTPGVYSVEQPIAITQRQHGGAGHRLPDAAAASTASAPMAVADVDGVKVAGLLFDAGTTNSAALLTGGPGHIDGEPCGQPDHGAGRVLPRRRRRGSGKATNSAGRQQQQRDRRRHLGLARRPRQRRDGLDRSTPANTGLLVNGANVLATGLFVEHYQQYQVLWNGENGQDHLLPERDAVRRAEPGRLDQRQRQRMGRVQGGRQRARTTRAWGLGSYCFFNIGGTSTNINAARGFEVPDTWLNVKLHDILTVSLGGNGTISNVVNNTGGIAQGNIDDAGRPDQLPVKCLPHGRWQAPCPRGGRPASGPAGAGSAAPLNFSWEGRVCSAGHDCLTRRHPATESQDPPRANQADIGERGFCELRFAPSRHDGVCLTCASCLGERA